MRVPDTELLFVLGVVLLSAYVYTRVTDSPEIAQRLFIRTFTAAAVILVVFTAYLNYTDADEPFPFDTDGKIVESITN